MSGPYHLQSRPDCDSVGTKLPSSSYCAVSLAIEVGRSSIAANAREAAVASLLAA